MDDRIDKKKTKPLKQQFVSDGDERCERHRRESRRVRGGIAALRQWGTVGRYASWLLIVSAAGVSAGAYVKESLEARGASYLL